MANKKEELKALIEEALKDTKNSDTKKGKTLRFTEKELEYIEFLKDVLPPEYMASTDSDILRLALLAYTYEEWRSLLDEPEENYTILKSWIEKGIAFRPYDVLDRKKVLGLSKEFADLELHYEQAKSESEKRLKQLEREEKEQAEIIKEESKVKVPEVQDLQEEIERLQKENNKLRSALQDTEETQARASQSEVEVIILYDSATQELIENVDVNAETEHGLYSEILTEIMKHKNYTFDKQEVKALIKENLKEGVVEIPLTPLEKTTFTAEDFLERGLEEGDDETPLITFAFVHKDGHREVVGVRADYTPEELEEFDKAELFGTEIEILEQGTDYTFRFTAGDKIRARKYEYYSGELFDLFIK